MYFFLFLYGVLCFHREYYIIKTVIEKANDLDYDDRNIR